MPAPAPAIVHVYRGTSPGWPGSLAIQEVGITCTSSDPLVATLFGLECLRHAQGVLQVARFERINGLSAEVNVLAQLECEMTFAVSPADFERRYVDRTLNILDARRILIELGFELPAIVESYHQLHGLLKETQRAGDRLAHHQIAEFDRRAFTLAEE